MPLKKGYSKATQAKNFHELKQAGYTGKQRIAIVLSSARAAKKKAQKK